MDTAQGYREVETPRALANRLGIKLDDISLLSRALTHRSYLNENIDALEDNERLEFLGDAVLDFLVGAWLYNRFPEMPEGELTRMRSALVCTDQLAEFAEEINLGGAMRLGRGEADNGGRERSALLCATFEAVVGAIYLGSGLGEVQNFFDPFLNGMAHQIYASGGLRDPKSSLQEWTQAHGDGSPKYRTISATGPDHEKFFEIEVLIGDKVYGRGSGHSKQIAAKAAAHEALAVLVAE